MWRTNLKIALTVLGTLAVYTAVANMIPQVESEVPREVAIGPDVTPEELVRMGEEIFHGVGGCQACHALGERAPRLLGDVGRRCGERVPGMSCKDYLHESLVDPNAYVVEGFQPIMPDAGRILSPAQIWAVVAFLESQGGEVTVTAEDLPVGEPAAAPAAAPPAAPPTASRDPGELVDAFGCLACHQLAGQGGPVGPPFEEVAGKDPGHIRRAILFPNADTTLGYEAFAGTMPMDFGERMTAAQLEAIVSWLAGGLR